MARTVTFSHKDVIELISKNFVPVWESVAPVRVAIFDLGDGKEVRGTVGGEIVLYFCRPDGKVFDMIPALQTPHVTYWGIKNALEFYNRTKATDKALKDYHGFLAKEMERLGQGDTNDRLERTKKYLKLRELSWDPGSHDIGRMVGNKSGTHSGGEAITIFQPGGLDFYRRQIHGLMTGAAPQTPEEWKQTIFVKVLEVELKGGVERYNLNTLEPFAIIEED